MGILQSGLCYRALAVGILSAAGSAGWSAPGGFEAPATLDELRRDFSIHLAQPRFAAATWGVKIISLDTGATLFEHNAGKLLKPASNAKLYTGALALDRLGPDFRIRTSLQARRRPDARGRLRGDLLVFGRGDPSFAARFNAGDHARSLEPLVRAIGAAGIKRIEGDLVGDESFFRGPPFGTGWAWDDLQFYFGAEVSALTVDDNTVDLFFAAGADVGAPCRLVLQPPTPVLQIVNHTRTVAAITNGQIKVYRPVGENWVELTGQLPPGTTNHQEAVTVPRPGEWFLVRLHEALHRAGILVAGKPRLARRQDRASPAMDSSQWIELGHAESRPMAELVQVMMKTSQNLYAQLLLLQVGARETGEATAGLTTEQAGLVALKAFLRQADIPEGEVLLEEGAGLSHGSAVTPNATVSLLRGMAGHPQAAAFRDALPVAGGGGTLRRRMVGAPGEGNVRAKSGTLHHVTCLSGYVASAAGERLAFAIMLNQYQPPDEARPATAEVDALVNRLAAFSGRSVEAWQR